MRSRKGSRDEPADGSSAKAGVSAPGSESGEQPAEVARRQAAEDPPPKNSRERDRWILIALCGVIAVLLVGGSVFALGYYMGHQSAALDRAVPGVGKGMGPKGEGLGRMLPGERPESGREPGAGEQKQGSRLREFLEDENVEMLRGTVSSVEQGGVTVATPGGEQVIDLSEETRYTGAGAAGRGPSEVGSQDLKEGIGVVVVARKLEQGKKEAISIRILPVRKTN